MNYSSYAANESYLFGFTLIEMLVVMAIFSLLASVVSTAAFDAQVDARDTQRQRDLNGLRSAVSIYFDQNQEWPTNLNELKTSGIMTTLPEDPTEGETYGYATGTTDFDVCLMACMEDQENAGGSSVCSSASYSGAPTYIQNCDSNPDRYPRYLSL